MFKRNPLWKTCALILGASLVLSACDSSDDGDSGSTGGTTETKPDFQLSILHINDHHSHLEADTADLDFNGESTRVEIGGFPNVVSKIKELAAQHSNVLKLHAGDAITGTLYYSLFKGQADADMMNQVCFDAFALGNHEFDDGDAGLKNFLNFLKSGSCQTDVLAANVVPEVGVSPLTPSSATDSFKPYVIKELGGEKMGLIGIDIANKTKNSSNPDASTQFLDETTTAQQYIDELTAQGVNKIVLLTHYQYKNDITLAQNLSGVDVIIGGDSHSLLGNTFANFGLTPEGPYPTEVTDKDGKKVCIAQAWQYAAMVGELITTFDGNGEVKSCSGTPHLLLADSFKRENADGDRVELQGAARQAVLTLINSTAELGTVVADVNASAILSGYSAQVEVLKTSVIGTVTEDLCLERIPGQGRSSLCNVNATRAQGSDISNIVALAFKEQSNEADIAIQNGGGVRVDVPAGAYTIGDAYTLLPFSNTLVNLQMTGADIVAVLEDAFDYAINPNGSSGAYPYASGLRWDVDRSKPKGQRFSNVQVKLKGESQWSAIDLNRTYTVVTNDFIASGQDGYSTFAPIFNDKTRMVDTYLEYAQSFVDYVTRVGTVNKLPVSEYSTQNYYDENGLLQQ